MAATRQCNCCGQNLPRTAAYFYKRSDTHGDGLKNRCIPCTKRAKQRPPRTVSPVGITVVVNLRPGAEPDAIVDAVRRELDRLGYGRRESFDPMERMIFAGAA